MLAVSEQQAVTSTALASTWPAQLTGKTWSNPLCCHFLALSRTGNQGNDTGGRFGTEAVQLLRLLARHRADSVPAHLRPATITSCATRWSGLLAVAAQRAYAATLLELPPAAELGEGPMPDLHEVLADARWD